MNTHSTTTEPSADSAAPSAVEQLDALRAFQGAPREFWASFLRVFAALADAPAAILLLRQAADGPDAAWRRSLSCFEPRADARLRAAMPTAAARAANACLSAGAPRIEAWTDETGATRTLFAVPLPMPGSQETAVACCATRSELPESAARDTLTRLRLAADAPRSYQVARSLEQAKTDIAAFAGALDLMTLLNNETRFVAAAMTLCNELAARFQCSRISLGWKTGPYVRVQAISHMERFEKKMQAVQEIEQAMEETLDQDEELLWPCEDATAIRRDHEAYARSQGVAFLCSLPLRLDSEAVGVLLCERDRAFDESDARQLRVYADQAARRIGDLKRADRWFGARWATALRERAAKLFGVEHTWRKVTALASVAAIAFLVFGRMPYRVQAPFILRCEDIRHIPAPFDAYIEEVRAEKGDRVAAGDTLLILDRRELLIEESSALADQTRYLRESEKARADGALAEMRIALAQAQQAEARLALVRHRIEQSVVKAPFDGIVTEGDLKEMVGAPVRQGNLLFKVARLDRMYAELDVREADVGEAQAGRPGYAAFASRPHERLAIRVLRVEPAARSKPDGNVFLARADLTDEFRDWWRPGMSGVAKLDAGRRSPLWLLTHRTVEYLALRFW